MWFVKPKTPDIVIGLGETGLPLFEILKNKYKTIGYDVKTDSILPDKVRYMNICIPFSAKFVRTVTKYQKQLNPDITIIHSTVPVGTTAKIQNSVHSPIRGKHGRMKDDIKKYPKWVGGQSGLVAKVKEYFLKAGIRVSEAPTSEDTEILKLLCLAKYGASIAMANICREYALYDLVIKWDCEYNEFVDKRLRRPIILNPDGHIGGHCVIQNTKLLNEQYPHPLFEGVLRYE